MKLFEFIEKFIARNSSVRLWKKKDRYGHILLTERAVMEWEILKIKELSAAKILYVTDIVFDKSPEAINIVIDTPFDEKYISKLFRNLETQILKNKGYYSDN